MSLFVCARVNVCQICAVQPLAFWELHHLLCCKSGARSVSELLVHTKHHLLFCNLQLYSLSFSCCVCGQHELRINQPQKRLRLASCWRSATAFRSRNTDERLMKEVKCWVQSNELRLRVCVRPPLVSFSPVAHQTAEPVCEHRLSPDITRYPVSVPLECVCADGSHRVSYYSCRQTPNLLHLLSRHLQTGPKTHASLSESVVSLMYSYTTEVNGLTGVKNNNAK